MLRVLMQGGACIKEKYADGHRRYRAMSYERVCAELGIPNIGTAIKCVRLKLLQSMVADPKNHQLFLSALLSKYEFEDTTASNPWAEQFCGDILALRGVDGVQYLVDQIGHYQQQKNENLLKSFFKIKSVEENSSILI